MGLIADIEQEHLNKDFWCKPLAECAGKRLAVGNGNFITQRQYAVLHYWVYGASRARIAEILSISQSTVRVYLSHLRTALDCFNSDRLAEDAVRTGILLRAQQTHLWEDF